MIRPVSRIHAVHSDLCAVAPSPQLRERLRARLRDVRGGADVPLTLAGEPRRPGFNDGMIRPPSSSRRAGALRGSGSSGSADGHGREGGRGEGPAEAVNAGLAAAAQAARSLMSEVKHQWSPRRRT